MLFIAERHYPEAVALGLRTNLRKSLLKQGRRGPQWAVDAVISTELQDCVDLLALNAFGEAEDLPNASRALSEGVERSLEYFWGEWRDGYVLHDEPFTVEEGRLRMMWIDQLRDALLISVLAEERAATQRLAAWVGDDLEPHQFDEEWSAADVLYYKALAAHIRGGLAPYLAVLGETRGAKTKRAKLLGAALNELAAGDGAEFLKALTKYVQYWRKSERRPNRVDHALCADGNILLGLAQQEGVVSADEIRRASGDLVLHLDKLTTASTDP